MYCCVLLFVCACVFNRGAGGMDDQNIILHMAICSYKSAFLLRWVELDLYRGRHWYIMRLFKGTGALQSILL
jgi:hypothetical protein